MISQKERERLAEAKREELVCAWTILGYLGIVSKFEQMERDYEGSNLAKRPKDPENPDGDYCHSGNDFIEVKWGIGESCAVWVIYYLQNKNEPAHLKIFSKLKSEKLNGPQIFFIPEEIDGDFRSRVRGGLDSAFGIVTKGVI